jgi:hypothetical protein
MKLPWIDSHAGVFRPFEKVADIEHCFARVISTNSGQRWEWATQLAQMMSRVAGEHHQRARSRNTALRLTRLAVGGTAAFTALTGSSLLAHLRGPAATTIGVIAVVLGITGAALAALRPQEDYARDVVIAAEYERLWWEMYVFATTDLPEASAQDFAEAMKLFAEHEAAINSRPGGLSTSLSLRSG